MRKSIFSLLVLIIVLGALPLVASAQAGGTGTGSVKAEGDGIVHIRGNGWVRISGEGTLGIVDLAGDAVIDVSSGNEAEQADSAARSRQRMVFRGFDGDAYVEGSRIIVWMRGKNISLEAEGTGIVRLRGQGWYEFNGESGEWTEAGVTLNATTSQ
jgi:hypothetical protein